MLCYYVCEYKLIIIGVDGGVDVVLDVGLLLFCIMFCWFRV